MPARSPSRAARRRRELAGELARRPVPAGGPHRRGARRVDRSRPLREGASRRRVRSGVTTRPRGRSGVVDAGGQRPEPGPHGVEVAGARVAAVGRPQGLVPGLAGRADQVAGGAVTTERRCAGELPHHPVAALDPHLGGLGDGGVVVEHLEELGERPLQPDGAPVAVEPRLGPRPGHLGELGGLPLGAVVLPQLGPRVGAGPQLGARQRGAVGQGRQHRAAGEVEADAGDRVGLDVARRERAPHGVPGGRQPVGGVLEGPPGGQRLGEAGRVALAPDDLAAGVRGRGAGCDRTAGVGDQRAHGLACRNPARGTARPRRSSRSAHWCTLRGARNDRSALRAEYRTVPMARSLRSLTAPPAWSAGP